MDKNSTTGVNRLIQDRFGIIFKNSMCPYCGNRMRLVSMSMKGKDVRIRYICDSCGLILPLGHDENNFDKVSPMYDETIKSFLDNFGVDIRNNRLTKK